MGFDQYHEPPDELPAATRTFARLCASLTEEAEAIGWYEQRIAVETDPDALAVMRDALGEEFKHFSMDLEFLLRRTPVWREIAQGILFQPGDIVQHGEEAESELISTYLPAELSEEDLRAIVERAVRESGAESAKDMGVAMKQAMAAVEGRADGKRVSGLVRASLQG